VRISLLQLDASLDAPQPDRVARVAAQVRAQDGADLVILPELWAHGAFAYDRWADTAEPLDGPTVSALAVAARELGAIVHAGTIIERAPDGRLYNTAITLSPAGELVAHYRKLHRFGFGQGEATELAAGSELVTIDLAGTRAGIATCYDLRFPELFRALLDRGAELFVLSSAWPDKRIRHWRLLAQARAVESQGYVLACNAAGEHAGVRLGGNSLVADPWGDVLAEAGAEPETLVVEIDPSQVARTRKSFPVLADRRPLELFEPPAAGS
jgi:predicted amidohydrolase